MSSNYERDQQRERDLRAVDPRATKKAQSPRMAMLRAERTAAEEWTDAGGDFEQFVEPEGK